MELKAEASNRGCFWLNRRMCFLWTFSSYIQILFRVFKVFITAVCKSVSSVFVFGTIPSVLISHPVSPQLWLPVEKKSFRGGRVFCRRHLVYETLSNEERRCRCVEPPWQSLRSIFETDPAGCCQNISGCPLGFHLQFCIGDYITLSQWERRRSSRRPCGPVGPQCALLIWHMAAQWVYCVLQQGAVLIFLH